jgi:hypothetical protein
MLSVGLPSVATSPRDRLPAVADDQQETAYQLAYQQAERAITQQAGALDEIRGRAGTLLAVASLATSFLGGLVLGDEAPVGRQSWLAMIVFVVVVALTLHILLPRRGWRFAMSARTLIGDYIEADDPASVATMYRELALYLERNFDCNEGRMKRRYVAFAAASALLGADVLIWLTILVRRR